MELPSIKFNIFTKLEYFLVIKEFDKQFKVQFKLLKSKEWNKENVFSKLPILLGRWKKRFCSGHIYITNI